MQIVGNNRKNLQFKALIKCGELNTRKQRLVYQNIENTLKAKCPSLLREISDDVVVQFSDDGAMIIRYVNKSLQDALQSDNNIVECNIATDDSIPQTVKKSFEFLMKIINKKDKK